MTNDKDKATQLVESVFGKQGSSPIYQTAGRLIAELRAAAFRDMRMTLSTLKPEPKRVSESSPIGNDYYEVTKVYAAIERAAANEEEGD